MSTEDRFRQRAFKGNSYEALFRKLALDSVNHAAKEGAATLYVPGVLALGPREERSAFSGQVLG